MILSSECCEKHNLDPFFVCNILLIMTWILEEETDFDIENYEKYLDLETENQLIKKVKNPDTMYIGVPDLWDWEILLKEKLWNPAWTFTRLAEEIHYKQINKAHVKFFAKLKDITWENFLLILKSKNPFLDTDAFTADCKASLTEEPDDKNLTILIENYNNQNS